MNCLLGRYVFLLVMFFYNLMTCVNVIGDIANGEPIYGVLRCSPSMIIPPSLHIHLPRTEQQIIIPLVLTHLTQDTSYFEVV